MPEPTREQSEQLAALWTQAQPAVSAYIATLIPDFHQAEEVLQRVAVTLVRKFDEYDPSRPFVPWAVGVARFEVLQHRRAHVTDLLLFDNDIVERVAELYEAEHAEFAGWRAALRRCVSQLEGRNKTALNLRYTSGLKPEQIAEQMGMTGGAVRSLLHRVRAALRKCMEREAKAEGGTP